MNFDDAAEPTAALSLVDGTKSSRPRRGAHGNRTYARFGELDPSLTTTILVGL